VEKIKLINLITFLRCFTSLNIQKKLLIYKIKCFVNTTPVQNAKKEFGLLKYFLPDFLAGNASPSEPTLT
jgi:hypothetical protein